MNTAEVLNTPGYYYAIAYALSVFVITCTNERKIGRWKLAAVSCAQFALLLFFMTVTDGVRQELFVPSMLLIVLLLLGYIYICNDFSLRGGILPRKGVYQRRVCGFSVLADILLSEICKRNAGRAFKMGGTDSCLCRDLYHAGIDGVESQKRS